MKITGKENLAVAQIFLTGTEGVPPDRDSGVGGGR